MELRVKLERVEAISKGEKKLKAGIKSKASELQAKSKETIETLSNEEVIRLLEMKWIDTLISNLSKLPDMVVDGLVSKIQTLGTKYATTYFEVESQIKEIEKQLCSMIDDLEGNEFDMKGLSEFKSLLLGE